MIRAVVLGVGLWLAGVGMAPAQAPENSLPDGTFASTKDDCAKLATKTPAEIGDEIDFEVLTKKGLTGYRQVCDFVSVSGARRQELGRDRLLRRVGLYLS